MEMTKSYFQEIEYSLNVYKLISWANKFLILKTKNSFPSIDRYFILIMNNLDLK